MAGNNVATRINVLEDPDLPAFRVDATTRLGGLEISNNRIAQGLEDLRTFETNASNRLRDLEAFKNNEFTPWQTSANDRLGNLEREKLVIDSLVNKKVSIEDYEAARDHILHTLKDHRDKINENTNLLEALGKNVQILQGKPAMTDRELSDSKSNDFFEKLTRRIESLPK